MTGQDGRATPAPRGDQLRGFQIGVTSDRRSEDLITALQRRGAQVMHAPALKMVPHLQEQALVQDTRAVIAARPDYVLITTGYGMRRWLEVADAAGLGADLTAVLEQARVLARGPKALGAVRAAGLENVDLGDAEVTSALVDRVLETGGSGTRVAVQLHGSTDDEQLDRLRAAGATVLTVTPYRWVVTPPGDGVARLVEALARRELDAVTFTSAPAAAAVLGAARAQGRLDEVCAALRTDVLAAVVGPVTAAPLLELGVQPVQPQRSRMGALIRLVCDQLEQHRVLRLRAGAVTLELRGRCLRVDDRSVLLGPNARALFRTMASSDTVVSRQDLLGCLSERGDAHALEVAMSRLRRSLAVPGLITTVVRRGYRLNATRLEG